MMVRKALKMFGLVVEPRISDCAGSATVANVFHAQIKLRKGLYSSITNAPRAASKQVNKMKLSMKKVLIMLAALPLLAAAAETGHFSGRVFDNQGAKQLSNAIVTVSTPAGFVASVNTDKKGDFNFNGLPEGEYDFRVTAHGFAVYERHISVANSVDSTLAGRRAMAS